MDCSMPGLAVYTNSQSLLKLMSSESVMPSSNFILCNPLLLLPSIFPSIRVFQMSQFFASGGQKYCSFSFSISPSDEYSGLICFRMDWLDLLAVQGTLMSLFQHHSSKASILRLSASFPSLEPVRCSISGFNCCFLTCIQVSQEAGKVVLYSISGRIFHSLL